MQNTNGHQTYTPLNLLCKLRKKTTQCVDGGQHDSHEFLRHLLEIVRNEDLRVSEKVLFKCFALNIFLMILSSYKTTPLKLSQYATIKIPLHLKFYNFVFIGFAFNI